MIDMVCVSRFVKNLSVDFEKAVSEARLICGEDEETEGYSKILLTDENDVQSIIRLGTSKESAEQNGILVFGKYKGQNISDIFSIDKKYVEWIAKGCPRKDERKGFWYDTLDINRPIKHSAIALLIGSGDWIERKGKFMSVDRAAKLDKIDAANDHWFESGKRIELEIKQTHQNFYDNAYGTTWIITYELRDGRFVKYVGSNPISMAEGVEWFKVKATVKHTSYNDNKETHLQRIAVL